MTQNLHLAPEYWVNTIFEFTNMCINQNVIEHFNRGQESTSYMEIFAPIYFCPFPSFLAGKFKTENSNVLNYLFLNTIVSEQIQAGAKLFESVERRKLQGAKLTLFTE